MCLGQVLMLMQNFQSIKKIIYNFCGYKNCIRYQKIWILYYIEYFEHIYIDYVKCKQNQSALVMVIHVIQNNKQKNGNHILENWNDVSRLHYSNIVTTTDGHGKQKWQPLKKYQ